MLNEKRIRRNVTFLAIRKFQAFVWNLCGRFFVELFVLIQIAVRFFVFSLANKYLTNCAQDLTEFYSEYIKADSQMWISCIRNIFVLRNKSLSWKHFFFGKSVSLSSTWCFSLLFSDIFNMKHLSQMRIKILSTFELQTKWNCCMTDS